MSLDEIINAFNELVEGYNSDPLVGSGDVAEREALHTYADKFTDLYRLIREPCRKVYGFRTQHDDKASTATRARIARKIADGDPSTSWNKALNEAPASEDYAQFLQERVFYYESWDSISHLRDTIKQYIINIGSRLSNI